MLTDAKLRNWKHRAKRQGEKGNPNRQADLMGMYAIVSEAGTVSFRYEFRWPRSSSGKHQVITYGRYPEVPLASFTDTTGKHIEGARDKHLNVLRQLKAGINPMDERRQERQKSATDDDTFRAVGDRWYDANKVTKKKGQKDIDKSATWLQANRRYLDVAYRRIGARRLKDVTAQDLSAIITPVEASGRAMTAEKMRQTYVMVFDYAAGKEFLIASGANPARVLKVNLPDTKHHAHLDISEVPAFLKKVDEDPGSEQIRIGVKLLFLCLTRKMELCGAKWSELNLDEKRWLIPAVRMKGGKHPHIVPLSTQAAALFRRLKELSNGSDFVFPHRDHADRCISDDTLRRVYERAGYEKKATPHGCRSTASSALNELGYESDWIERQLAHTETDEVRDSYNSATYMIQRRKMLQDWADTIDRICAGQPLRIEADNVLPFPKSA